MSTGRIVEGEDAGPFHAGHVKGEVGAWIDQLGVFFEEGDELRAEVAQDSGMEPQDST